MSHSPKYVPQEAFMSPFGPISAGKSGQPEVISSFGVKSALSKLLFSTNFAAGDSLTFGAVTLTAVAASPTAVQFIPGASLSASLDALVIQFQAIAQLGGGTYSKTDTSTSITYTPSYGSTLNRACSAVKASGTNTASFSGATGKQLFSTNFVAGDTITFGANTLTAVAAVSMNAVDGPARQFVPAATLALTLAALAVQFNALDASAVITVTDTNTSLTCTPVTGNVSMQVSAVKTSGGTNTATQSTNLGIAIPSMSLDTEHTQFTGPLSGDVYLPDADESQRHTVAMLGAGTVNVISAGSKLPGAIVNYAMNGADALSFQWLSGKWRLVFNDGAVAT